MLRCQLSYLFSPIASHVSSQSDSSANNALLFSDVASGPCHDGDSSSACSLAGESGVNSGTSSSVGAVTSSLEGLKSRIASRLKRQAILQRQKEKEMEVEREGGGGVPMN